MFTSVPIVQKKWQQQNGNSSVNVADKMSQVWQRRLLSVGRADE
jgi:hypothetical protein